MLGTKNVNSKKSVVFGIAYILFATLYSGGGWLMPRPENGEGETGTRNFVRRWGKKLPIIGGVFVLSYYICIYGRKPANLVFNHILKPIGKGVFTAAKVLGRGIQTVSLWTYDKVLKPVGRSISTVAKTLGRGIQTISLWTYDKVLKPVGRSISTVAKALGRGVQTVSLWTYDKVLKPVGNGIKVACVFSYTQVLKPIYNFAEQCTLKIAGSVKNGISWIVRGYNSANVAYDNAGKKVEWYQDSSMEVDIKKATWYAVKTIFTAGGTLIFHAPTRLEDNKYYLNDHENRKESKFREVCRNIAHHVPFGSVFASVLYVPALVNRKLYDYGWNSVETQNFLTRRREFRITIHNKFIDFLNFNSEVKWRFKCWRREKAIEFKEWRRGILQDYREWRNGTTKESDTTEAFIADNRDCAANDISQSDLRAHKELYTQQDVVNSVARTLLAMLKDVHNDTVNKLTRRKHLVSLDNNLRKNGIIFSAIGDDGTINAVKSNPTVNDDKVHQFTSQVLQRIKNIIQDAQDESVYKDAKKSLKEIGKGQSNITNIESILNIIEMKRSQYGDF